MIPGIHALVDLQKAAVQHIDLPLAPFNADVLRIDKIHAIISGNKWFKLKYALEEAISLHKKSVLSFGGTYSNHLLATAYACAALNMPSIGIIRGEQPAIPSFTLEECRNLGMQLHYISRDEYRTAPGHIAEQFPGAYIIEEGGRGGLGVKGAADIARLADIGRYTHICCAVGTGTMMAGLINSAAEGQHVSGICALKLPAEDNSIDQFIQQATGGKKNYTIHYDYHFGGYAKKTGELLAFMNDFYTQTNVPLDFVYTAKMMYGIMDLAAKNHFSPRSRLLIIHSGGLQGNRSLPKNTVVF